MMRTRTGLLVLVCVAVAAACLFCTASARDLEQPARVAAATPGKPTATVVSWKSGKRYSDAGKNYHAKPEKYNGEGWRGQLLLP
jgi:hypothetical protein